MKHTIELLTSPSAHDLSALADVLHNCVEGGASVGFMWPFTRERADAFWANVAAGVRSGTRRLLVARDEAGVIVGTAQLAMDLPDNQAHRADVCKVLVHGSARKQGIAQALMQRVEQVAADEGKSCLVLDTVTGSAAYRLYQRMGWQIAGDIPHFAHMPDGARCSTTYFYKLLRRIAPLDPFSAGATALLAASTAFADALYPSESNHLVSADELARPGVAYLGAWVGDVLVGCGALKRDNDGQVDYGEIKRVFVHDAHRAQGHAQALMRALHAHARATGLQTLRLETGIHQPQAIALYEKLGYRKRGPFGDYSEDPLSVFMERSL
jgi:ribosomal protein S18 acetylase RimI-like enzyme